MGTEFTIRFEHPDPITVVSILRRLPIVHQLSPNWREFELRAPDTTDEMPDASMTVETDGLYFCDYGGNGREIFGRVIACLVGHFGPVKVEVRE